MTKGEGKSAALRLAEEIRRRPLATAAIAGGAAVAATGAYVGARALARRNGKPINAILATAVTACEAAAAAGEDSAAEDPAAGDDESG